MLLDPLADKLMVSAAYIVLVAYTPGIVPPWIAVVVIGREFLVSGLRSIAASEGFYDPGLRYRQAEDGDPDRVGGGRDPEPPLGGVGLRPGGDRCTPDRGDGDLLDDGGFDYLGGRLLHRFLEDGGGRPGTSGASGGLSVLSRRKRPAESQA